MTFQLSTLEATARAKFDARRKAEDFMPMENAVLVVFHAMWHSSLSVERIKTIACAMHGLKDFDVQFYLTRLVKAKVLRSRRSAGNTRLYEVAL